MNNLIYNIKLNIFKLMSSVPKEATDQYNKLKGEYS